ncbi:hypothetical protein YDYSG_56800 [Paenibacillus tyrfis]|nr:hypothetical protein YDYSG_56800 [Paenibacillus tyrfis]
MSLCQIFFFIISPNSIRLRHTKHKLHILIKTSLNDKDMIIALYLSSDINEHIEKVYEIEEKLGFKLI